ncbi:MAG: hypothetical protein F6J98_28010 [Moorea sp. SIO4G2]|nr:hypothetical protein [Moorena sp. SIO4G2]
MQRGLGGFPHSLLHQDGSREYGIKNYHNSYTDPYLPKLIKLRQIKSG